jgi:hypothetical protein
MIVKGLDRDCKRVRFDYSLVVRLMSLLLLYIVEKSGFEFCNVICTPFLEVELYDMGPEP